jgi:alkylated DNA nucleotide flippase Atl1
VTAGGDGKAVGFDGSEMRGRAEVARQVGAIMADHDTPAAWHGQDERSAALTAELRDRLREERG